MIGLLKFCVRSWRAQPRALQLVWSLWLALGVAVTVRTVHRPTKHTVFPVFAAGALHWWSDAPVYANYEPQLDYFRYPPVFAIFMTPFAWLGLQTGGVLWSWLNLAILAWGAWRFLNDVLPSGWSPERGAAFLALVMIGSLGSVWNAQSNSLALGLTLLGAAAVVRKNWWPAAAWLAASLCVKMTPVPIVLLLAALWPRQLVGRLTLLLLGALLMPFLTRSPAVVAEQYDGMVRQFQQTSNKRWEAFRDAWTIYLVAAEMLNAGDAPPPLRAPLESVPYRALQMVTAAAVLFWCLWWMRRTTAASWQVRMTLAMGAAWVLLFGPAVEQPTYIFLAPSLAWALLETRLSGRFLITASAVMILVLGRTALIRPWQAAFPWTLAILPLGTAFFTAWLLRYAQPSLASHKL